MVCFPKTFLLELLIVYRGPNPMCITTHGLGSSYFARHYSRNRFLFLFLWVLRCFSSPRSLLIHYFTHVWILELFVSSEFPHSDISGLMDICSSPKLFAAYHVLLRLLVPRYPPYALCSLTLNPWKTSSCFISLSKFFLDVLMYYLVKFCSWNKPILVFDVFFLLKHYSFWSVILKLPFWIVFWFFRFNRFTYYFL